jgi:hypothetical protein
MIIAALMAVAASIAFGFCVFMVLIHGGQMDTESLRTTKIVMAVDGGQASLFAALSVFVYFKLHPSKRHAEGFEVIQ